MRTLTAITALFLAYLIPLAAQVENHVDHSGLDYPDFFLDAISFQSSDSLETRLDVYAQVPYDAMKFVASDSGFTARYEITINILSPDGSGVVEKVWSEEVHARTFEETLSKTGYSLTQRSFGVPPGSYTMRIQLRELESGKVSVRFKKIAIPDYTHPAFSLSDLMLVNRVTNTNGRMSISPNVSGNLYDVPNGFYLFFEVYNGTGADSIKLDYKIFDVRANQIFAGTEQRHLEGKKSEIIAKIDSSKFPVGVYQLEIDAETIPNSKESAPSKAEKKRNFVMRWGTMPLTIVDLDLAIRQARYIASGKEYDAMIGATTIEEKQRLFQEFWRRRDPSPDTQRNEYMDEYYSRVQYSNEHFSHYLDGWRTDMGMVFIVMGSPNNVDRHPFDYDSKPYEVWSYYDYNAQVVFVDESGIGDYKLMTPVWDLLRRAMK